MADFKDVVKALAENNKKQDKTTDSVDKLRYVFEEHFKFLQRQIKDQEEAAAEAAKVKRETRSSPGAASKQGPNNLGLSLGMLLSKGGALAGITALVATLEGLRGWELKYISKLRSLPSSIIGVISKGMDNVRLSVLRRIFGIGPEGKVIDYLNTKGEKIGTQTITVAESVQDALRDLRNRFWRVFGIGADGKLITLRDPDGLFTRNIIGRTTFQIGRILKPLMRVSEGVASFATGTGKKLFEWLSKLGAGAGPWLRLFGNILKPLGFFFSLKEGYDEFMQSDKASILEKSTDAIGAFLGDFIGAPLDLLKDLVSGAFKLIGWDDAAKTLDAVSIEENLKLAFQTILDVPRELFNWVKTLFTDPAEAGKQAWNTFLTGLGFVADAYDTLTDVLIWPVNKLFNYIGSFLGWTDPENPIDIKQTVIDWTMDFFTYLSSWLPNISEIGKQIKDAVVSILPDWLKDYLIGSGTVDEAARKLQIAEYERILKTIDKNNDNIITSEEYEEAITGRGNSNERIQLRNALRNLKELRGEEIPSSTLMEKGGQSITINNVDNSVNTQSGPPAGSSDKKYLQGSGMSSVDLRYEKKYMSMRGFGVAIGQVH